MERSCTEKYQTQMRRASSPGNRKSIINGYNQNCLSTRPQIWTPKDSHQLINGNKIANGDSSISMVLSNDRNASNYAYSTNSLPRMDKRQGHRVVLVSSTDNITNQQMNNNNNNISTKNTNGNTTNNR